MRVIDAPVLDYVFQPLADRLGAFGVTPFQVARFFIDGAAVTLLGGDLMCGVTMHQAEDDWVWAISFSGIMMLMTIAMIIMYRWFVFQVERRAKPGMMNAGRVMLLPARLIGMMFFFTHLRDVIIEPSWAHAFNLIGFGWWMIGCYFASCSQRPPKFQLKWWWGLARV
jgi:hypothetical protein